jgi:hypothetical protein
MDGVGATSQAKASVCRLVPQKKLTPGPYMSGNLHPFILSFAKGPATEFGRKIALDASVSAHQLLRIREKNPSADSLE